MIKIKNILIILLFSVSSIIMTNSIYAGHHDPSITDSSSFSLYSFFDLRDRETFVQITNTANPDFIADPPPADDGDDDDDVVDGMFDVSGDITVHVQIFNVDDNCNENNFFDTLTPNDTHIYNMRDIQTNNGSPSGVVLPDGAYGFIVISAVDPPTLIIDDDANILIGNFRILDNNGYEYRTNSQGITDTNQPPLDEFTFNFNNNNGVTLSDVVFIAVDNTETFSTSDPSVEAANILDANWEFEVDIADNAENIFSCRNVIFACVTQENPLYQELLEESDGASVASFEYGINNAIPHSKGGELLCPGNTITEGVVLFDQDSNNGDAAAYFIGLNNGNGRGSMDSWWRPSDFVSSEGP